MPIIIVLRVGQFKISFLCIILITNAKPTLSKAKCDTFAKSVFVALLTEEPSYIKKELPKITFLFMNLLFFIPSVNWERERRLNRLKLTGKLRLCLQH